MSRVPIRLLAILVIASGTLVAPGHSPAARADSNGPPFTWTPTGITARLQPAMAFDEATGTAVLFGGQSQFGQATLGDTWTSDGTAWTPQSPPTNASPMTGASMAYDPGHHQLVLFGTNDRVINNISSPVNETWTWDGSTWTMRTQTPVGCPIRPCPPPSPQGGPMAYDAASGTIVTLSVGSCDNPPYNLCFETWTWDGSDWTQQTPADSLPTLGGGAMAYDASTETLVLFEPVSCDAPPENRCMETWTWNGSNWHQETPADTPPVMFGEAMAYDAATGNLVLFGGNSTQCTSPHNTYCDRTWTWNGLDWHQESPATSPPPRYLAAMTYDPVHQDVILFGGAIDTQDYSGPEADWWTWDGTDWTQGGRGTNPQAAVQGPSMAYDAARQQVVFYGGDDGASATNDTWSWDGSAWSLETPANRPPKTDGAPMAYDAAHQQIVLFTSSEQTWTWDGVDWTSLTTDHHPSGALQYGSMAYDGARGNVVLFGGLGACDQACDDTWTWDGSDWTRQHPDHSPPARSAATMAYDPVTQQVVLFGGSSAAPNSGTNLGDTWTWNGSDWTEEHPDHSPPARYVAAMAFDPSRGTVVLFGGSQGVHKFLGDTWEWAGSDWTELSPAASPPSHAWGAMAFDSNGNALLYGGFDGDPGRDNSSYSFGAKPAVVRLVGIHGGAVATRPASTKHPLSTSLRVGETPTGGMVSITQLPHSTLEAPAGYAFLPAQDVIAAPKGSSGSPLTLRFTLDPSLIPRDPEDTVSLFRTEFGRTPKLVTACTAAVPPKPDPCVSSETVSGGALKITVSTTSAATWNFAVRRPDAKIKLGSDSSSVGGGIYNLTGFRQTRTVEAMRGVTKTFDIGVQNDGTSVTGFRLKGLGSGTDFTVKYLTGLTGTTDITSGVVAGTYTLRNVPADGTKFIRLQITVRSTAAIGSMFGRLVTAVSTQAGVARDAVKGVASVIA